MADLNRKEVILHLGQGGSLANLDLSGLDLSGLPLRDAKGADLSNCDLSGANLSNADLSGCDLTKSNLNSAIVRGAKLKGAKLCGCDLQKLAADEATDLTQADLSGSDMQESRGLTADSLAGAKMLGVWHNGRGDPVRALIKDHPMSKPALECRRASPRGQQPVSGRRPWAQLHAHY